MTNSGAKARAVEALADAEAAIMELRAQVLDEPELVNHVTAELLTLLCRDVRRVQSEIHRLFPAV